MLKIYKNKVVIDGHEQTKEQCETMTLLANALKDSKDFKIVDYKNGYAEFEKVGNTNDLKFPPAPSDITMVFDTHIIAINSRSPMTTNWTTSGQNQITGAVDGTTYTFDVVLKDGYVIDTVTLSNNDEAYGKLNGTTENTFSILAGAGGISQTVTITSKKATSQVSIDLITLSDWGKLESGEYSIRVVANADGYESSEYSQAVKISKGNKLYSKNGKLISYKGKIIK